ncbi:16S rRNA (cytidine(1402)-2'-O)-methyltransferase [Sulfuricystis multivorans]|uniref:16S rRNA (cytidine(1402)-2'-O)-methyltransferase n=1 Tax=Sulfuricystis multivorans TaxID=2211108 RepID=UPI0024DFE37B|nr:16S rRNA (cytidine(1402)-2'-O)-methyltransferase [Sulfuricystis multivorans]
MSATLFIVATPIGNLSDITLRALETLRSVAVIACEDTRHARRLLDHYGIRTPLLALYEHNERQATERLIALLGEGKDVALISDAGTPAVSDPGALAVAAVHAAGFRVSPIPGANAAIAALSAAGFEGPFCFVGFLPTKVGARRTALRQLKMLPVNLVFYEAPHRIVETVADLASLLEPEREIVIARELTKLFEEIVRLPLLAAPAWLAADENRRRGEFVLLVSGPPSCQGLDAESERILELLLTELPVKTAAKLAAEITGKSKNELYARALEMKGG